MSTTEPTTWPDPSGTFQRRSANVCGFQMSYITGGHGAPIVLIHGLGSDANTWRKVLPQLAQQYTVYAVDMLGCGQSDKPSIAYTIEAFAHYMRYFMDAVGIERAHLVGHSLGGASPCRRSTFRRTALTVLCWSIVVAWGVTCTGSYASARCRARIMSSAS